MEEKSFKSDLKAVRQSRWSELFAAANSRQTVLQNQKARMVKSVLVNGWTSSGTADERRHKSSAADTLRDSTIR